MKTDVQWLFLVCAMSALAFYVGSQTAPQRVPERVPVVTPGPAPVVFVGFEGVNRYECLPGDTPVVFADTEEARCFPPEAVDVLMREAQQGPATLEPPALPLTL